MKCAVRRAVKVIHRCARERTIEKTVHNIYVSRISIEHYL